MIKARRFEHWLRDVRGRRGPEAYLWLEHDDRRGSFRLVGLDRKTGARVVDQKSKDAGDYVLADDEVFRRDAVPGEPPLPKGFDSKWIYRHRAGDDVVVRVHPTRGKVKTRLARLHAGATAWDEPIDLPFHTINVAMSGRDLLVRSDTGIVIMRAGKAYVELDVPFLDDIDAFDGMFAFRSSVQNADGRVTIVSIGFLEEPTVLRSLAFREHVSVTITKSDVLVSGYHDVAAIAREDVANAPIGDQELVIEDIPTPPPTPAKTARVITVGESTGIGFVVGDDGVRKRLKIDQGRKLVVGETIAIETETAQVVEAWYRVSEESRALDPTKRSIVPMDIEIARAWKPWPKQAEKELPPRGAFVTAVVYATEIRDSETDEVLTELKPIRSLDGQLEGGGGDLLETGIEPEIDIALVSIWPVLRFDAAAKKLRFVFEFHTNEQPNAKQVTQMYWLANELMESAFGNNYEFAPPEDFEGYGVFIGERISSPG